MPLRPTEAIHCDCCEKLFFLRDIDNVVIGPTKQKGFTGDEVKYDEDKKVGDCPDCGLELYVANIT